MAPSRRRHHTDSSSSSSSLSPSSPSDGDRRSRKSLNPKFRVSSRNSDETDNRARDHSGEEGIDLNHRSDVGNRTGGDQHCRRHADVDGRGAQNRRSDGKGWSPDRDRFRRERWDRVEKSRREGREAEGEECQILEKKGRDGEEEDHRRRGRGRENERHREKKREEKLDDREKKREEKLDERGERSRREERGEELRRRGDHDEQSHPERKKKEEELDDGDEKGRKEQSEEEGGEHRKRRRDREEKKHREKKREEKVDNRYERSRREDSGEEQEDHQRKRSDREERRHREKNREERGRERDEKSRMEASEEDGERNRFLDRDRQKDEDTKKEEKETIPVKQLPDAGTIRTGGIYIPPHRMAQMMRDVQDKSSDQYQRLSWDALRKSINGLVNKVNATNIKNIIPELLFENLIRGRGLFCRSCMKSQMASPGFTDVFAALVAVVNTKFPEVGKLLLKRIVLQLKRAYKRNDKPQLLAATKFIAHLVNQQVAHEIIALELLTVLLENPTDDSVEVAVGFVKECGALLQDFSPQGLHGIFERFRGILHEGEIDKRVQFLIEGLFAVRKAKFQGFPAVRPELDLVEQEDQFTHEISLEDEIDPETSLDVFKSNPQYLEDEKAYEDLKRSILGDESSDDEEGSDAASDDEDEEDSGEEDEESMKIKDETETNLVNLRRTIYLTIMSSVDFEEAGHKLLKIKLEPGQEMELCIMLLECCSQERIYLRYYGLLGQRFCMINKVHQENFEKCFVQQYSMIHRLETNKLRNVAKFFAHLLGTSALPWHVLSYIRLTEEDTTSSSRIFIKIIFQELSEHLGIRLLNERLNDPTMQDSFESIFPKDNPKNTRFSINFFTSIGLGGITESLREYLKNMPRLIMQQQKPVAESDDESGSSAVSSSGGSSSESDSASESESESSSDESDRRRKRRR
ncbi:pre-mRNA-splicing factor CWC22-like protein [Iris pallida]|uniref:Pre-mRNA-splicing factor CWC22-like protein n=1 Tax=Iris pallida TaxID=29817 RepID=A0AAX6DFU7_IRIPA|nr:pre-mRNA-splicing factor CWC22-like protein [Iris pallida]